MVYFLSHSNAVLTDALESIINVVAGVFALCSLSLSARPKDENHPYGHGKVEFISAGFEGVLMVLAGVLIVIKSIISFYQPRPLEHLDLGVFVILGGGIINFALGFTLKRSGQKHNSIAMIADGQHLLSDAYASFGIMAGLALIIWTKINALDNVVAIIFGLVIAFMGSRLARKSVAGIMDEVDEKIVGTIVEELSAARKPQWIDVHNLRVIQYGNKLHIDCHATLPWYFTLEEAHHEVKSIEDVINHRDSAVAEFFIHADPCIKESCKICMISDCKVRQEAFKQKIEWNSQNVQHNLKHGL